MELLRDFAERLKAAAKANSWIADDRPLLASKAFRGSADDSEAPLPNSILGLQLGAYPVLISNLSFDQPDTLPLQIRKLHNQMLIARSFMTSEEVVDAHIFLVCDAPPAKSNRPRKVLEVERNEAVCRKLVWVRDPKSIESSFLQFIERTFLAHPWANATNSDQVPLDQNTHVINDVLVSQGLTAEAAARWIKAAGEMTNDHEKLVEELVNALETLP